MPEILRASTPVVAIYRGEQPIETIYRGSTLIWSAGDYGVHDSFSGSGALTGWRNDLVSGAGTGFGGVGGTLFSDGILGLVNGFGQLVGSIVGFVPGDLFGGVGTLVSPIPGLTLPGLGGGQTGASNPLSMFLGLLNGIPILGELIPDDIPLDIGSITSLIGMIPVLGQLAQMIGLAPNAEGEQSDFLNFITDDDGLVLGVLSGSILSQYLPNGGEASSVNYIIGETNGTARMLIPDGLVALDKKTSRFRSDAPLLGNDGYLQIRVANIGDPRHITQVFRRYSNTGYQNGVGIDLRNSSISLVRRVGGVDTLVAPDLSSLNAGDTVRLTQEANLHKMFRNGSQVGEWNDSGATAATGASNRHVGLMMQGGKDLLGSRRFSPSLDYVSAA